MSARQARARPAGRGRNPGGPARPDGLGGEQVEGRHAVRELLRAGNRRAYQVMLADGIDETDVIGEILDLAEEARVPVRRVARDGINALARSDSPQGVIARADPVPDAGLDALARSAPGHGAPFLLVLDGVTDPHNLGAVMRSGLCAGVTGLVIGRRRAAHLTPTAVKAAAGAVEHLPIATVPGIPAALAILTSRGVWTVALVGGATSSLWDLQLASEPVALVLGAEGRGVSRLARARCDVAVGIPTVGPLESLNVSAAATLACFEVARRRQPATGAR
ncbi:MAG TPA: 23S rRNA (guanosine(2251)-2'-O)-methyltransferase RlmB [Acidimicrobiales bacterium]|nr:23S rRNA (guanosine(2251)-2'-O)-methyltransferase RlmB [Acidimicrobiales bacterium]